MQWIKLALELGPLAVFFLANNRYDLFVATGAFMAATIVSLIGSRLILKRLPVMPLITGVFVLTFGGLTLYLQDETFIKMKPTVVNVIFSAGLATGLLFGRSLIKLVLEDAIRLTDEGWQKLTIRWSIFFLFLAILNEIVWRNFSSDFWVNFKTFGIFPLTMVFMLSQIGLLQKYQIEDEVSDP